MRSSPELFASAYGLSPFFNSLEYPVDTGTFGLFQVVPGGEMKSDVEGLTEESEEVWDELRTSVGSDVQGNSVFRAYMKEEKLCKLGRSYCVMGQCRLFELR